MPLGRRATVCSLGIAALLAGVVGCGSPAPASAPATGGPAATAATPVAPGPQGDPVSATGQRDGVLVTLAASSSRILAGTRLELAASALNLGLGPVTYESGGCGPIQSVRFDGPPVDPGPPAGNPPQGDGWEDALLLARWSAMPGDEGGLAWIRLPGIPEDVAMGCPANLDFDELAPGETWTGTATWDAEAAGGVPAPGGRYTIGWSFPFVGRHAEAELAPDAQVRPVPVSVAIEVEAVAGPRVAAHEALDAAVADERVRAWAQRAGLTKFVLTGASIELEGDAWRWRIGLEGGDAIIRIDATTGEVVEVPGG